MADKTSSSIPISAPRTTVMSVIADFGSYPDWATGVKSAEVLEAGAKTVPISSEAAAGQIESALRLHRSPGQDIFIKISATALAAAVSTDPGAAEFFASGAAPGSQIH